MDEVLLGLAVIGPFFYLPYTTCSWQNSFHIKASPHFHWNAAAWDYSAVINERKIFGASQAGRRAFTGVMKLFSLSSAGLQAWKKSSPSKQGAELWPEVALVLVVITRKQMTWKRLLVFLGWYDWVWVRPGETTGYCLGVLLKVNKKFPGMIYKSGLHKGIQWWEMGKLRLQKAL